MKQSIYHFTANKTFSKVNEAPEFYQDIQGLGLSIINKTVIDGVTVYYLTKATTMDDALAISKQLGIGIYARKRLTEGN